MTSEFAKRVLDFLAQKAGKACVLYDIDDRFSIRSRYYYDFYVKDHANYILPLYFDDNGRFKSITLDDPSKLHVKPYVWLLKTMLKHSQQNKEIICFNHSSGINVFLKPKTTLEQILVEMDLIG